MNVTVDSRGSFNNGGRGGSAREVEKANEKSELYARGAIDGTPRIPPYTFLEDSNANLRTIDRDRLS